MPGGKLPAGYFQQTVLADNLGVNRTVVANMIKSYDKMKAIAGFDGPEIRMFAFGQEDKQTAYHEEDFVAFCDKYFPGTIPEEGEEPAAESPADSPGAIWEVYEGARKVIVMGISPTRTDIESLGPGKYRIQRMLEGLCHGIETVEIAATNALPAIAAPQTGLDALLPLLPFLLKSQTPSPAPAAPPMTMTDVISIFKSMQEIQVSAEDRILNLISAVKGEELDAEQTPIERIIGSLIDSVGPALPALLSRNSGAIASALQNPTEQGIEGLVESLGTELNGGNPLGGDKVKQVTGAILQALAG